MKIEIEISNYRCFAAPTRARIGLDGGIVALVGTNNSGKSALLRFFYEFRNLFLTFSNYFPGQAPLSLPREVGDPLQLFSNANDRNLSVRLFILDPSLSHNQAHEIEFQVERATLLCRLTKVRSAAQTQSGNISISNSTFISSGLNNIDAHHFIEACRLLSDSLYIPPFRNILNVGGANDYFDIPIGDAFVRVLASALSGEQGTTAAQTASTVRDEIERIFRFQRLEFLPADQNRTLQLYIDRKPYRLGELGSGLTQFILVLYLAATKNPSLLLIDEPEANLHPSLQLDFLTSLASYTKSTGLGTLIATHSLGLATGANGRIYSVSRKSQSDAALVRDFDSIENPSELLGEMSYAGRYDLGLKKILLVEGTTDIKVMQQFLRKLNYDHEVTILPLGGSTIISKNATRPLIGLLRLSRNLFIIADSETKPDAHAAKSVEDFRRICVRLRIPHLILDRRAIENYFTDPAIGRVMGERFSALEAHEQLPAGWSKSLNWRIAREMPWEDIAETDLGNFLQHLKNAEIIN